MESNGAQRAPQEPYHLTTGGVLLAFYPDLDNVAGSADARCDSKRLGGAVVDAGTAFDAAVVLDHLGLALDQHQHLMRADLLAFAAPDTLVLIQHKGCNTL